MFDFHNSVILFSLIYPCMLCHLMFKKKKNMHRICKEKRIKVLSNMVASMFLGDIGVICDGVLENRPTPSLSVKVVQGKNIKKKGL